MAVIFDMDGVLLDSEVLARRLWVEVFADAGYDMPESIYHKTVGRTMAASRQLFHEYFPTINAVQMDELFRVQDALYRTQSAQGEQLRPGVVDLLDYLQKRGVVCAVGSSTYIDDVEEALTANGIRDYFSVVVGGDMVAKGKPAPDIYLKCLKELGLDAADCLVIEDSKNGLLAAREAEISAVMIPDLLSAEEISEPGFEAGIDFEVFASLAEIQSAIADPPTEQ
jgi:HAD superfamily hydrolase (TIGR01509 family)